MTLTNILLIIFSIYILICIFIFFYQRNLLYHPGENNYLDEGPLNHKIEKIYINSESSLVGWHFQKNQNYKTILFFHGNAGKLDNRIYKLNEFSKMNVTSKKIILQSFINCCCSRHSFTIGNHYCFF